MSNTSKTPKQFKTSRKKIQMSISRQGDINTMKKKQLWRHINKYPIDEVRSCLKWLNSKNTLLMELMAEGNQTMTGWDTDKTDNGII
jgi:signal peptidase I